MRQRQPNPTTPSEGELFKKSLGPEWQKLHPDIRKRFGRNPSSGQRLRYTGMLTELRCSIAGKLLGYLTWPMIGGALIPFNDADFPVDIEVFTKPGCDALFKQRVYRLNGRRPIEFTSYMREGGKGEVLEYVGMGLGMKLLLSVRDANLHFTSDGYFWEVMGRRIPLPDFLSPGKTHLVHRNEGPGQFSIRIEIRHRWFGTMFTQAGVFSEVIEAARVSITHVPGSGERPRREVLCESAR